ncbi:hypothetical protein [Seohaeicola zhoushanensis]|uniref:Uncharacterized protein n=1 Tax=Seohaeicola zhoushanensis TaxID=1569283 RepID=A0A8J3M7U8_9RHOB|nr:hypothetical protein [Seohaeicola zhoushanensis]GHF54838.1 hypothetical protein GCM10017056_27950 [Seohaeicola zhoushanensis]
MIRILRRAAAIYLALVATVAPAQVWVASKADDGAYVYGSASPEPVQLWLSCNAPSATRLPPLQVGAHEETVSAPYTIRLEFSNALIPGIGPRADIHLWVGQTAYLLPQLALNEMTGVWELTLSMADPMLTAMRAADRLVLAPGRDQAWELPVQGLAGAAKTAMQTCVDAWISAGFEVPPALSEFAPAYGGGAATPMRVAADAAVSAGCNGPATRGPEYLLAGNIDGDGTEDIILDWRAVECLSGPPRPYCGASMCSAEIFLSSAYPRSGRSEDWLALGVELVPLSNGNDGVRMGVSQATCAERGLAECALLYYWDGLRLRELP